MYLRKLQVRNLKRLRALDLDLTTADGHPRPWTVIIGANGTGKSSLLQAIALAASGEAHIEAISAGSRDLMRDRRVAGDLEVSASFEFAQGTLDDPDLLPQLRATVEREPPLPGPNEVLRLHSHARLSAAGGGWRVTSGYRAGTRNKADQAGGDSPWGRGWVPFVDADGRTFQQPINPLTEARRAGTPGWFVAGYGTSRVLPPSSTAVDLGDPIVSRMRSLFDPRAPLTSFNFASVAPPRAGWGREFAKALGKLMRDHGPALLPTLTKLELRGTGGGAGQRTAADLIEGDRYEQTVGAASLRLPAAALAHGHQSTLAWVSDLIGHILLSSPAYVAPANMEGLVLIDELDLHLHPTWQRAIIGALRAAFPLLQFIVTTHSPLLLASARPDEVVHLVTNPETGHVEQLQMSPTRGDPRLLTSGQLLARYFGVDSIFPTDLGRQLDRYGFLVGYAGRSDDEELELSTLRAALLAAGIDPGWTAVERDTGEDDLSDLQAPPRGGQR